MRHSILASLALGAGIALDQLSKHWADAQLQLRGVVSVVPGVLDLRYARNAGAFFSLGADLSPGVGRVLLTLASVLALALIGTLYARATAEQKRLRWAFVLLASGAVGNLIDRVRNGQVTDFLHLHVGALLHWATFNVADVLITFGLVLLCWEQIRPQAATVRSAPTGAQGAR